MVQGAQVVAQAQGNVRAVGQDTVAHESVVMRFAHARYRVHLTQRHVQLRLAFQIGLFYLGATLNKFPKLKKKQKHLIINCNFKKMKINEYIFPGFLNGRWGYPAGQGGR